MTEYHLRICKVCSRRLLTETGHAGRPRELCDPCRIIARAARKRRYRQEAKTQAERPRVQE